MRESWRRGIVESVVYGADFLRAGRVPRRDFRISYIYILRLYYSEIKVVYSSARNWATRKN